MALFNIRQRLRTPVVNVTTTGSLQTLLYQDAGARGTSCGTSKTYQRRRFPCLLLASDFSFCFFKDTFGTTLATSKGW